LLVVSRDCPACGLAERVWSRYFGDSIEKAELSSLDPGLREQLEDEEKKITTPQFAVVLSDGRVLGTLPAIPSGEELLATCALCGSEENLERCNLCGGIYLCPRCRRRHARRLLAGLSKLLLGWWKDDLGIKRRI